MGVAKEVPAQAAQPLRFGPPPRGRVAALKAPTTPSTVTQGSSGVAPLGRAGVPAEDGHPVAHDGHVAPVGEAGRLEDCCACTAATASTSS